MNAEKVDFYQEVIIKSSYDNKKYIGKKGVVLGISEENGIIYGYAIFSRRGKFHLHRKRSF